MMANGGVVADEEINQGCVWRPRPDDGRDCSGEDPGEMDSRAMAERLDAHVMRDFVFVSRFVLWEFKVG